MRLRVAVLVAVVPWFACKGKDDSPPSKPGSASSKASSSASGTGATAGSGSAKPTPPPTPAKPLGTLAADPGSSNGTPKWALPIGGLGSDVARDVAALPSGGSVVCGDFEGEATFGALGKRTAVGKSDAFVMAIDGDGKPQWLQTLGGAEEDTCESIAVGSDGTIAIGGLFADSITAAGNPKLTAKSNGSDDLYVAGFKADGTPAWLWATGAEASDSVRGIAATADGAFVIAGDFYDKVPFGDTTIESHGYEDGFLAKVKDGDVLWAKAFGGDHDDRLVDVAVDSAGSIIALGEFQMTASFGGDVLKSNGGFDLAIAKYDADGNHLWSHSFGDTDNDNALGAAIDPAGNITMVGSFDARITVGKDSYQAAGNADILILHFAPDGTLVWSKAIGGEGEDVANGVAADASGNLVVCGWFEKTVDFGKGKVKSNGNKDAFVLKLGPDGAVRWVQTFGDRDHDKGHGVAIGKDGDPLVAGIFRFTLKLPAASYDQVMDPTDAAPKSDAFVMRLAR